jgi:hypothetical protein
MVFSASSNRLLQTSSLRHGAARRFACAAALSLLLATISVADQPASDFLSEAQVAWRAYADYAKKLQGSLKSTAYSFAEGKRSVRRIGTAEQKQCGNRWLLINTTIEEATNADSKQGAVNKDTARVATGGGAFRLVRRDRKSPWVLTHYHPDQPDPDWIKYPDARSIVTQQSQAGLYLYGSNLAELRTTPGFTFTKRASERDGEELVRFDFTYRPTDPKSQVPFREGWVRLDPARSWLMRDFRFEGEWVNGKAVCRGDFEYEKGPSGLPIVKRFREITERMEAGKAAPVVEYELEYDLHEQEVVPPEEFTLAAFGLPEPTARRREVPTYWYLTGAGIACLVLAGAVRWRSRRAVSPDPSVGP